MSEHIVYFAPVPGGHKPAHPSAIYVRRPAGYMKTANSSASAIRVEAYAKGGPVSEWYLDGQPQPGEMSAPVFVELLWVSGDHRRYWDLRTGGRTGSTGDPADFLDPNVRQFGDHRTDVDKLRAMIARAQTALDAFHAPPRIESAETTEMVFSNKGLISRKRT